MIASQVIKKIARAWNLKPDTVEKHYVLGWILHGIVKSSIGSSLVFKGGTALSKIHYPSDWRLSEDLDFTLLDDADWNTIIKALSEEVPMIVQKEGRISVSKEKPSHKSQLPSGQDAIRRATRSRNSQNRDEQGDVCWRYWNRTNT